MFYDSLVLIALIWGASLPLGGLDLSESGSVAHLLYQSYLLSVCLIYFVLCWHWRRATLGMRAWNVYITADDGTAVSWRGAIIRAGGAIVSWGCLGLGYLWEWLPGQRRCWHDHWSATRLIHVPRR